MNKTRRMRERVKNVNITFVFKLDKDYETPPPPQFGLRPLALPPFNSNAKRPDPGPAILL